MNAKARNASKRDQARCPGFPLDAPCPAETLEAGNLRIIVYEDASDMGLASALSIASEQCRLAEKKGAVSLMLMAAPSAEPFYGAYISLVESSIRLREAVRKTHFFQFDDYRLPLHSAASFRYLLCRRFFFPIAEYYDADKVHLFQSDARDIDQACRQYGKLIMEHGPDLQLKGTGENGHWGFHEPGIPLDTPPRFQRVKLSEENVAQQMRDHPRLFRTPDAVPTEAFTANVALFMRTRELIEDNVPQASKAFALLASHGSSKVDAAAPSSALKKHRRGIVRATLASAWALLEYRRKGVVSASMLARMASATAPGGAARSEQVQASMRKVLEQMRIECE